MKNKRERGKREKKKRKFLGMIRNVSHTHSQPKMRIMDELNLDFSYSLTGIRISFSNTNLHIVIFL